MATDLRAAIARDLEPVRPLWRPSVRALTLAPVAVAVVIAVPALHFFRPDLRAIGLVRAWGFSIGQAVAGLIIVSTGLRESVPGRALSRAALAWTVGAGFALPAVLLILTASTFDLGPAPGRAMVEGIACFRTSAIAALPALILAAILAARALPLRPGVAGALYGLGCGLIADAGLRLYCEYSAPLHVLVAHGGAVVGAMMGGALIAIVFAPRQA